MAIGDITTETIAGDTLPRIRVITIGILATIDTFIAIVTDDAIRGCLIATAIIG